MLDKKNKYDLYTNLLSILVGNAVVVYGVVFLNWNFFMVIYSYWFGEFISSVFDRIKYRTLKKRKEVPAGSDGKEGEGRFLFLFVYWIFIVVIAGFLTAPENTFGENLMVIFFLNKSFNVNLLFVLLGEWIVYYQRFVMSKNYHPENVVKANGMVNRRTMIMHISIIAGAFAWFAMHEKTFFIYIDAGKYGDYVFMLIFVAVRVVGELAGFRGETKKRV